MIDDIKHKLLELHKLRSDGVTPLEFSQRWEYDSWAIDGKIVNRDLVRHRKYKKRVKP